jgi:hypothetical protein
MAAEQERLAAEMDRQKKAKEAKAASQVSNRASDDFSYKFAEGMEKKVKLFRQRGRGGDGFLIRIDHQRNEVCIEEEFKSLASLEELVERLEDAEASGKPRYVLYIHEVKHSDGRVQYPVAFMLYMPNHTPVDQKVLYTRPVVPLSEEFKVPKHIVLEELEDLDTEWLEKQLNIVKK